MTSQKNNNVDWVLIEKIGKMCIANHGSNFMGALQKHLANMMQYAFVKGLGPSSFPDRQVYQSFVASAVFLNNLEHLHKEKIFQLYNPTVEEDFYKDYNLPTIDVFHYTDDVKEMHMNRGLQSVQNGDVLNLRVVDDQADKYLLQILNKYRDKERFIDRSVSALLIKDNNPMVREIYPPLKKSNLLRAVSFGLVKEKEVLKLMMSVNPNFIGDPNLRKHLKLGRVFKKDIAFYPVDKSDFSSFIEFLDANSTFESPKRQFQHTSAFQCDPLTTGPLFKTYYKKQLPVDNLSSKEKEVQKFQFACEKSEEAKYMLSKGDITNALLKIEEVLKVFPENDEALTTRGKIYLAMAGGKPSSKVHKAMTDFEAALKINCFNEEAAAFRDSIIMASIRRFTANNLLDKAAELQSILKTSNDVIANAEAFLKNIKFKNETMQTTSNVAETGAADPIVSLVVKEEPEPMDLN